MIDIGKMIAQLRSQRHYSQQRLGDRLGMTKQAISNYETGKRIPDYETLEKIADALNAPITFFISKEEKEKALSDIYAGYTKAPLDFSPVAPDLDSAAVAASEILIKHRVCTAPVLPMPILKSMPGVFVVSFTEFADRTGTDRRHLAFRFGAESQDAITIRKDVDGMPRFYVAYNQRLPFYMVQVALARELGRIVMGHNLDRPVEAQTDEALYFARHLLCPRPLIRAIHESGLLLTVELLGNITGCYGRTLAGIRQTPGASVPAHLNRRIREQFTDYVRDFALCQSLMSGDDDSGAADFGTYMDNYAE